jgi:hypothetical protein
VQGEGGVEQGNQERSDVKNMGMLLSKSWQGERERGGGPGQASKLRANTYNFLNKIIKQEEFQPVNSCFDYALLSTHANLLLLWSGVQAQRFIHLAACKLSVLYRFLPRAGDCC